MKIINLILKNNIPYEIPLNVCTKITDIGSLVFPPAAIEVDVIIKNIRVNHSVSAENVIVADTAELTADAD